MAIFKRSRRGSALLTVLWISAALAAIGFALANTVRGETERVSTTVDDLRAYYLASGAVERAAIEVLWSAVAQTDRKLPKGTTRVDYTFQSGMAHVEIIPEAAKLDVNSVPPDQLARLLEGLGVPGERIGAIVEGVTAWRAGRGSSFSSLPGPTFPGAGTSFQEIEEILAVRGVTPDLFYGNYVPAPDAALPDHARLVRRSGLVDCLSVFGSKNGQVDANTADPAVLHALGMPDSGIQRPGHAAQHQTAGRADAGRHDAAVRGRRTPRSAWKATPSSPFAPPEWCARPTANTPISNAPSPPW